MIHKKIRVKGKVQGVFFRASAKAKALELGIKGFVKNESDGSVYIEAEGKETAMQAFLEWCRKGPPAASVQEVWSEESKPTGFKTFDITR